MPGAESLHEPALTAAASFTLHLVAAILVADRPHKQLPPQDQR